MGMRCEQGRLPGLRPVFERVLAKTLKQNVKQLSVSLGGQEQRLARQQLRQYAPEPPYVSLEAVARREP